MTFNNINNNLPHKPNIQIKHYKTFYQTLLKLKLSNYDRKFIIGIVINNYNILNFKSIHDKNFTNTTIHTYTKSKK